MDAKLAYELAEIFMSETQSEITNEQELEWYTEQLSKIDRDYPGAEEYYSDVMKNIKILDAEETRLIRIKQKFNIYKSSEIKCLAALY